MAFDPHGRCNFCGNKSNVGDIKHTSNTSSHLYSGETDPVFIPLVKREHLYLNTTTDAVYVYNPLHGWTYLMTLSESGNSASLYSPDTSGSPGEASSSYSNTDVPKKSLESIDEIPVPFGDMDIVTDVFEVTKEPETPSVSPPVSKNSINRRSYFAGERVCVGQVTSTSPQYLNVDGDNIDEPVLSVNYDGVGLLGITWSVTISNLKEGDTIYLATQVNGVIASEIIETFDSPKIFSRIFNDFIIMNAGGCLDFSLTWHSDNPHTTITIDPHLGNHVTLWFQGH